MKIEINISKEILARTQYCGYDQCGIKDQDANIAKNCAIAVACAEVFDRVSVGDSIHIYAGGVKPRFLGIIQLPVAAIEFTTVFDAMHPVQRLDIEPFSFEIDVPDTIIDKIGTAEITELLEHSESLKLIEDEA